MATPTSPNTTFVSGAVYTATQANNFGFGYVGYINKTSNYALTATNTLIPTMTITFTAVANRIYRAHFHGLVTKSTAAGETYTSIYKTVGATTTGLAESSVYSSTSTATDTHSVTAIITGLAAGSTTIFVMASYGVNGGTLTGSSSNTMSFSVEDIGSV